MKVCFTLDYCTQFQDLPPHLVFSSRTNVCIMLIIMASSLNHFYRRKATMHSVCFWETPRSQICENIECCTTMFLWQIYVARNNKTYEGLYLKCPKLHWNKRTFVCSWPLLDAQFGSTDRKAREAVVQFLSFVSVSVKRFAGSHWLDYDASTVKHSECVCVLASVIGHENHIFSAPH